MEPAEQSRPPFLVSRRTFLGQAVSGSAAMAGVAAWGQARASSESSGRIRVAIMGVNDRGRQLTSLFARFPQVDVAYVCDPDLRVVGDAVKAATDAGQREPKVVQDFRRTLDDPNIDAFVCAAPDHWHALATVAACQAGKDVYVEKPATYCIGEGRIMIDAARKYGRVVQVGTQRRSGSDFMAAVDLVRSGRLGKVALARAWANKRRPDIGRQSPVPPPQPLDFDLWCGPAPNRGYKDNLVHYHWHWRWDYGTGECGNLGAHSLDVARWGLGVELPRSVRSGGGNFVHHDDKETPDTQFATFVFDDAAIQWEHRMWSNSARQGERRTWGVTFYGTEATLDCDSSGWKLYHGDELLDEHEGVNPQAAHIGNFLDCVVSRERPNADIEIGHRSAALPHLANIAYRTNAVIQFDSVREQIIGNREAAALMHREYRKGFELPTV